MELSLKQIKENSLNILFLQGRGALQDIDQMSLFKPLCKFCTSVSHVRDIVPTLKKAFQIAQSGTPGLSLVSVAICLCFVKCQVTIKTFGGSGLPNIEIKEYKNFFFNM